MLATGLCGYRYLHPPASVCSDIRIVRNRVRASGGATERRQVMVADDPSEQIPYLVGKLLPLRFHKPLELLLDRQRAYRWGVGFGFRVVEVAEIGASMFG